MYILHEDNFCWIKEDIEFNIKALHCISHHYTNSVTQNPYDKTDFKLSVLVTF